MDAFASEAANHISAGPASDAELSEVESSVGCRIPATLRTFLARFGGGLFFHGHEIFGPRRAMIHDIELVPDMVSVRRRLAAEPGVADSLIPFHRCRGVLHFIDARPDSIGEVVSLAPPQRYPDLASFLETVVLPRD